MRKDDNTGFWILGLMAALLLAGIFFMTLIMAKPKPKGETMALYHLSQDGGAFVDKENLQAVINAIHYVPEQGSDIRWEAKKDEYEAPGKVIPPWDVELGKDDIGLYHRNPYDTGTRVSVSTPQENAAWLGSL